MKPSAPLDLDVKRRAERKPLDQGAGLASEGRELPLTDNLDDEDSDANDSEGRPLEDLADGKFAVDFSDEILDEQFEYHEHMRAQDIQALEVVQSSRDLDSHVDVMMKRADGCKYHYTHT